MKHKRLVIASDLHCGSRVGLTPPGWQYNLKDASSQRREFGNPVWSPYAAVCSSSVELTYNYCEPAEKHFPEMERSNQ